MLTGGSPFSSSSGAMQGDMKGSVLVISASSNVCNISSTSASISASLNISFLAGAFIPKRKPEGPSDCLGKNGACVKKESLV